MVQQHVQTMQASQATLLLGLVGHVVILLALEICINFTGDPGRSWRCVYGLLDSNAPAFVTFN